MSNFEKLQRRLAAGETILMDGGMGSEFDRRGLTSPETWSGGPMLVQISDTLAVIDAAAELSLPVWIGLSVAPDGDELYLGIQDRHGGESLQDSMNAIEVNSD